MSTVQEELFAANIRKQITYLECLLKEMDDHPTHDRDFSARIRDVENRIRALRTQLHDD